jgi:amino acid adenylation domain-containing protein
MSELLQRFANLPPEKRQLILKKLGKQAQVASEAGRPQAPAITPVARDGDLPLSFSQLRFWLAARISGDNTTSSWSFPIAVRLRGAVNIVALQQIVNEIVRRHEVIRSTFIESNGEPRQVIAPNQNLPLALIDLACIPPAAQPDAVKRLTSQDAERPFDLRRGPLCRASLLELSDHDYVLCLVFHHIVLDGWSEAILNHEMTVIYKAFIGGVPSPLAELPIQYADYAVWQQERLQGEILQEQLSFWRKYLGDDPPVLDLPSDRPRAVNQDSPAGMRTIELSRSLTEAVKTLAAREAGTLYMTLLAAFNVLLHRYTGQEDICVGTIMSNRNRSELEGLVGLFLNTLVLRTDLGGMPTFRELVRRIRRMMFGVYAHQDLPFEKLLEELRPERRLGRAPLFNALFGQQNAGSALRGALRSEGEIQTSTASPGIGAQGIEVTGRENTIVDLGLFIVDEGDHLAVVMYYNVDLFDDSSIARMLGQFQTLLGASANNPDQPIHALQTLTEAELHQAQIEWNDSRVEYAQHRLFQDLFEAQSERTPDAVAAVFEDEQVTYGELNGRANRLARQLLKLESGPEQLVAVMARRNLDLLTVMLAAFKAGGVYLPLDPQDPPKRLHHVITQSGTEVILAADEFAADLERALEDIPDESRPRILSVEQCLRRAGGGENLSRRSTARNLSYVIYTSGSTGVPKGAMIEHGGMLNHLYAKIADLQLTGADVIAQTASQSFDISVWQFLVCLILGGRAHIVSDEVAHDPWRLLELVRREAITILETVPSLLRATLEEMVTAGSIQAVAPSLRRLLVTGEALPPELCRRWLSLYPDIPLLNAYGPTECSDDVTHHSVSEAPADQIIHMPIGRPVCNMRMRPLDRLHNPMPVGVPAELFVAGAGVGRGYLRQAGKTAEAFIPDPFSEEPGARLYKTGDLVRLRPDGNIEFLGRIDHQVKIRGNRIELGEIDAALKRHPAVRQEVVLAREDEPGDRRLVAYVVMNEQPQATPDDLLDFMRTRLPDFMVPSAVVLLDEMPLTFNGKIDRRSLPAPDRSTFEEGEEFIEPETTLEKKLAEIFMEILKVERVGIYQNFFHTGGHSLMAIRVIHRINQSFEVSLSVRDIFEEPTIAGLAILVEESLIEKLENQPEETV